MTHKERAAAALTLQVPDHVPTFELDFQLAEEMFGKPLFPAGLTPADISRMSQLQKEKTLYEMAQYTAHVYGQLDYSIIPLHHACLFEQPSEDRLPEEFLLFVKYLRDITEDKVFFTCHGDGTFAIPGGDGMYEFAYRTVDDPDGLKAEAQQKADAAIRRNKLLAEAGIEVLILCDDYCYNTGPFLSPAMFREFIQPYLYQIIQEAKANGQFAIKHTDGNIMPILDQLVECQPHALHSIDPMAGVDIREVKRLYGDKVCLCGNVHCAAMQTGTEQDVIDSAEYCLTHAKPGGGYIFCTSNVPFKGMPPERYQLALDVWKRMRDY